MHRSQGKGRRPLRRGLMAAALSAVALAAASQAAVAATDMFIKIGDIKGESQDDAHKGWIDLLSYSWGVSGPTRNSPKPQQPVGPLQAACAQEFTIMKSLDKASPLLFANAAAGTTIPSATVALARPDSNGSDYLVMTFSDVVITSVQNAGAAGGDRPSESISFNFGSVQVAYTPQSAAWAPGNAVTSTLPGTCR